MQVCIGENRIVLLFPVLKVAVKLPRIRIVWASSIFKRLIQRACGKEVPLPMNVRGCLFNILLRGITDNWGEFWFFLRTRHPFALPTYFSLLGLLNVQRVGEKLDKTTRENLWGQLHDLTSEFPIRIGSCLYRDSHHWQNVGNFCFWRGRLQILDYGSRRTQELIIAYGNKILKGFDLNWRYHRPIRD